MARRDQYARLVGGLGRALRTLQRYRETFEPTPQQNKQLGRAHWHIRKAMDDLEDVNRAARVPRKETPKP